jgi:hypothetical protein
VPFLDCDWKHCISLSSINPQKLFHLEELLNLPVDPYTILKFNINCLKGKKFCFYYDSIENEHYEKGNIAKYRETIFVPSETVIHYAESKEKGDSPLLFAGIMHILLNDTLDISEAETIK